MTGCRSVAVGGMADAEDLGVGTPAPALGDELALPKPSSPPVMGSTTAMAMRQRTHQERTAFHRADATSGQKDAPSGRADGA